MSAFIRQCVVWLTAGAFLCAAVGDGALHLLLDLSALPASGGPSPSHQCVGRGCGVHHPHGAGEYASEPENGETALLAEDEASGHNSGECLICQFTAMAKSAQLPMVPPFAPLPTVEAAVARPVVLFVHGRSAHLPRGPPLSPSPIVS